MSSFFNLIIYSEEMFTARKRSLGQGNIFTPVCHSVHGGACMVALGVCVWLLRGVGACMVAPGGVHGFIRGVHGFIQGGVRGFIWGHV